MIQKLDWDSNFFNLKIGKVEIDNTTEEDIIYLTQLKKKAGYDLLYLFQNEENNNLKSSIINSGGRLINQKVTYSKQQFEERTQINQIIEHKGALSDDLLNLVYQSGHQSRFRLDPTLNHKFKKMYRLWIEKSLCGELADKVFIHKNNNIIDGFITVKLNDHIGQIGLIAVDASTRGKGIGNLLSQKADEWYIQNQVKCANVVTQLINKAACNFYEKNGYSISSISHIYHF